MILTNPAVSSQYDSCIPVLIIAILQVIPYLARLNSVFFHYLQDKIKHFHVEEKMYVSIDIHSQIKGRIVTSWTHLVRKASLLGVIHTVPKCVHQMFN